MADSEAILNAVFKDWAVTLDATVEALTRQLLSDEYTALPASDAAEKVRSLVRREVTSMAFGFCVTIDGGSSSAETGMVRLVDENGTRHGGLHEDFIGYLIKTGRSTD